VNTPEPQPRPSLNYQSPVPRHYFTTGRVIAIAIALAIGISASQFSRLLRRVQLLYWQHQCLEYTFTSRQLILTLPTGNSSRPASPVVIAAPWQTLYTLMSRPGMQSDGTAFLHELVSPAGHRRLAVVNMNLSWNPTLLGFITQAVTPGNLLSEPKEIITSSKAIGFANIPRPTRVFGGLVDPADPSHFTIAVDDGPNHDHVDGYLLDDDLIRLEFHKNPATQPVPASPASSP
jgi:hypothetical protein